MKKNCGSRRVRSPRPRRRTHASRGGEPGCPRLCKAARRPQPRKRILPLPSCPRQRPAPGVSSLAHCPRRSCPSREHLRGRPAAGSLAPLTRPRDSEIFLGAVSKTEEPLGLVKPSARHYCHHAQEKGKRRC